MALTQVDQGLLSTNAQYTGFKNRIINGAMVIDQRNAGASGTANAYMVDRWQYFGSQASKLTWQQNAGSVTPPAGFSNYLGLTSSSAYTVGAGEIFAIYQPVEGFNFADMSWGTANAKTVTLSFWVRSSLTGTFGGTIQNYGGSRSYPISYTISSANTWEQKSVTVAGDTSGTWVGATNGVGVYVQFGLGVGSTYSGTAGAWASANYVSATGATSVVGTNGATFYITGVQLEKGSTATSFDYRPYGTELQLCQRYYERSYDIGQTTGSFSAGWRGTNTVAATSGNEGPAWTFAVPKRTAPTVTFYQAVSGAAGYGYQVSTAASIALGSRYVGQTAIGIIDYTSSGGANSYWIHFTASAEL
jgi:hypothetical protein